MPAAMQSAQKPATQTTTQPSNHSAPSRSETAGTPLSAPIHTPTEAIVLPSLPFHTRTAGLNPRSESVHPRASAAQSVLMITAIAGADSCASSLAAALGVPVEIASSRKLGLSALRRRDYSTVIVDDLIAEADPAGTDLI